MTADTQLYGIMLALRVERTGIGQAVDTSMLEGQLRCSPRR
jgi:crotonobetainyl-CoA:carnitine CoA-transferase CaiB-like acyl-CoA transferase